MALIARMLVALVAVVLAPASAIAQAADSSSDSWSAEQGDATRRRVAELVEQLGASEYIARRSAEIELTEIGLPAFDQVLAATESPDPEVAAASQYLLSKLSIEWASPDDPAVVRRLLSDYGGMDEADRLSIVDGIGQRLNSKTTGQGAVDALCRIVRFDPSEVVSRRAASAIINSKQLDLTGQRLTDIQRAQDRLDGAYGPSGREANGWLDRFVQQPELPAADALDAWRAIADAESQRLTDDPEGSDAQAAIALDGNLLRLQLAVEDDGAAGTIDRLVGLAEREFGADTGDARLAQAFDWLLEAKADGVIDQVFVSREAEMATKWGRYLLATVRARQGRDEEADRLATAALETPHAEAVQLLGGRALDGRVTIAARLRSAGYADWAHREYRGVVEAGPPLSASVVYARTALADSLQDAARYADASLALQELTEQINADARSKRDYVKLVEAWGDRWMKPINVLDARRHYYRGLAHRAEGDEESARRSLTQAVQSDGGDADVLIAMYRSEDAPAAYRRDVVQRIRDLAEDFEQQIENDPGNDEPLNQWAWLISNTEGDYERAIEYSQRSLQLFNQRTGESDAGYMDTLGRCYFAAGRFEDAVRTQRAAVEEMPHMQVMRRQLAEFEAALADSDSKGEE